MYKLCVFDLDGTIINSLPDIGTAMDKALSQLNLPGFTQAEYRRKVGNGAKVLCQRCLPEGKEALLPELLSLYNNLYLGACAVNTAPYPGALEMLAALQAANIRTAVISNKPHAQTLEVLATVLSGVKFDLALGQREGVPLKPAPDALLEAMRVLSAAPEDTLYIGDSPVDVRFGKAAGVDTCAVLWGYRDRAELEAEKPTYFAETPEMLLRSAGL